MWYAKRTAERIALAKSVAEGQETTTATAATKAQPDEINLDNLGENKPCLYGAELSKAIREDLKRRGVKGVTVSYRHSTICLKIKATAADFVSLEEGMQRYSLIDLEREVMRRPIWYNGKGVNYDDFAAMTEEEKATTHREYTAHCINRLESVNHYHIDRANYWELTTAFYNKVVAAFKIANQWNYDNSDLMTDYHDVGYYLDIDIKKSDDFAPRQDMTEEEKAAYKAEIEEEQRQHEEAMRRIEEERKQAEEARAKYEAWSKAATAEILTDVKVIDLEEASALYFTGLVGGIGKEASAEELKETIERRNPMTGQEAKVTRKVIFSSESAFDNFGKMFLHDFDFLAGKGGTASDDIRLTDNNLYYKLTAEQRETIKFYMNDCVAVYFNNELKFIIDPEGYNYARYVYIPTENTEERNAAEETKAQEEESKEKPAFYIPAPIEEQAAALHIGQQITVYKCDGWILNNIYAGIGIVTAFYMGEYAQYKCLWVELTNGKKTTKVFIRDNNDCLVYEGIKPALPDEITSRKINNNMYEMYNYNVLLPNTYNYYKKHGR